MHDYPILALKSGRERSVLNKHPWIYSGACEKISGVDSGDIVQVVEHRGRLLGYGHFNKDASIACRMFCFTTEPLLIDDEFWRRKMQQALLYRAEIGFAPKVEKGFRLFFSEGDGLPGLVGDVFGDVASLQIKSTGMLRLKSLIVDFLHTSVGIKHIYHKSENAQESGWLLGKKEDVLFTEQDLRFCVDAEAGQKTGYFLDQRDNRRLVGAYAKGKSVLDAFSYSGGFSVFALANGATRVTSIDASEDATDLCKKTMAANFGDDAPHTAITTDCFDYLRDMKADEHDLIVLDPPAFAKSASTVDRAARGYKDINWLAMRKIKPGGLLFTFSCSQHISRDLFRKIIFGAAKDANRSVRIVHQLNQAPDHPVDIFHPEGEYLKGLALYIS